MFDGAKEGKKRTYGRTSMTRSLGPSVCHARNPICCADALTRRSVLGLFNVWGLQAWGNNNALLLLFFLLFRHRKIMYVNDFPRDDRGG